MGGEGVEVGGGGRLLALAKLHTLQGYLNGVWAEGCCKHSNSHNSGKNVGR